MVNIKASSIKVLLIDDDEDDFIITKDLLKEVENASFDLDWVNDPTEGKEKLKANSYDIALIDYRLGEYNGIELIKDLNSEVQIPVILLTGQGDHETDLEAMKAGAVDYLVKGSFDSSLLERSIRYGIERLKSELEIKKLNENLEKRVEERTQQLQHINNELEKEITDRKKAEEEALRERSLIKSLMDSTAEGIVGLDVEGKCIFVNNSTSKMLGYEPDEMLGQNMHNLIHYKYPDGTPYPIEKCPITQSYRKGESVAQREDLVWKKDGAPLPVIFSSSPLLKEHNLNGAVLSITDISEKKASEEKIHNLAFYDPLTSLPNKILLKEKLNYAIIEAKKNGGFVGVMFLDLDRFKNVNDSLGHLAGDNLLKAVAGRLLTCVRETDTVSRQGGDEFIMVIPGLKHIKAIENIAKNILEVLSQPFKIEGTEIFITPSIGISVYPNDSDESEALIKYADVAMYSSKSTGRNTFRYFTPEMNTEAIEKLNTEIGLRKALLNDEFILYYQPKLDLNTNKIISVEALARWQHPLLGLIPPDKFIPAAEEIGVIEKLGGWQLDIVCKEIKKLHALGHKISIAVNISPRQINNTLPDLVKSTLEKNEVKPEFLELELTESDIMQHDSTIIPIITELKEIGVEISIDDFGTGYSSLSKLRELHVNTLKIDKSFINDFTDNTSSMSIIKAIIGIAKSLKLKVIAEGVETEKQIKLLKKFKCDQIQGYYISKPLPLEEIIELMSSYSESKGNYFIKNRFRMFKFK